MAQEQRVITPLVESEIQLEPRTPPSLALNTRIQRVWSMLFGRRENTLQPLYADRAGMLGVVGLDLNGWTLTYNAVPNENWTDMGSIVDLVFFGGRDITLESPHLEVGMTTGNVTHVALPTSTSMVNPITSNLNGFTGFISVRCRWYHGVELFGLGGRVLGYTAPVR